MTLTHTILYDPKLDMFCVVACEVIETRTTKQGTTFHNVWIPDRAMSFIRTEVFDEQGAHRRADELNAVAREQLQTWSNIQHNTTPQADGSP
jgi:hypothetical protein